MNALKWFKLWNVTAAITTAFCLALVSAQASQPINDLLPDCATVSVLKANAARFGGLGENPVKHGTSARSAGPCQIAPLIKSAGYYTPKRNTQERKAIMDAARIPISRDIGQTVIFVVDILRTDSKWAYLQAVPHQLGGAPLDWNRTAFRDAWANDAMSDVVMVLLARRGQHWAVVDYVIGPTDVHWYTWVSYYNLPETLFAP